MLSNELLLEKGFKLNTYPEGKFYEFETKEDDIMSKILGNDYIGDEEIVILQLKEDFTGIVLCVDTNNYTLSIGELEEILESL